MDVAACEGRGNPTEDKRIGKQVDSKSIALHGVAGSSPVSSALFIRCHRKSNRLERLGRDAIALGISRLQAL